MLLANPVNALIKSPILPLYAGVAGGIALSQCAERFNRLQQLESKVMQSQANSGKEESRLLGNRLEALHLAIIASRKAFLAPAPQTIYSVESLKEFATQTIQSFKN